MRVARDHMMSGAKVGWAQLHKENIVGRPRIDSIERTMRGMEVNREERNKEEPEMVDLTAANKRQPLGPIEDPAGAQTSEVLGELLACCRQEKQQQGAREERQPGTIGYFSSKIHQVKLRRERTHFI